MGTRVVYCGGVVCIVIYGTSRGRSEVLPCSYPTIETKSHHNASQGDCTLTTRETVTAGGLKPTLSLILRSIDKSRA